MAATSTAPLPSEQPRRVQVGWILSASFVFALLVTGFALGRTVGRPNQQVEQYLEDRAPVAAPRSGTIVIDDPFAQSTRLEDSWEPVSGDWDVVNGALVLRQAGQERERQLVVSDLPTSDFQVNVTLADTSNASGVVFRYVGPYNYWYVVANTLDGSWTVHRVIDGNEEQITDFEGPGESALKVLAIGTYIEFFLDGDSKGSFEDDALQDGVGVGAIVANREGATTRWSDLTVTAR